jgi:hypothetical protein
MIDIVLFHCTSANMVLSFVSTWYLYKISNYARAEIQKKSKMGKTLHFKKENKIVITILELYTSPLWIVNIFGV